MRSPSLVSFVLAALAASLSAQDDGAFRRAHPGRVLDAAGEPVAGAEVVFVALGGDGFGFAPDVVRATTGDSGRFRVELLPTRPYRAWAIAPAGALVADRPAATAVVPRGMPMTELRFDAVPAELIDRFVLAGLDAWREHGEVRVEVRVADCPGLVPGCVVGDDDSVPLPPLPDVRRDVHVFVDGRFVHAAQIDGRERVRVPPPQRLRAVVRDPAGAPIAGARIERIWSEWRESELPFPMPWQARRFPVAETGADGTAEWWVAAARHPFDEAAHWPPMVFAANADGRVEGVSGFTETVVCNNERVADAKKERVLPFRLEAKAARRVRFPAAPAAARLVWLGAHSLFTDENSYTTALDRRVGAPFVDGAASLSPPPNTASESRLFVTGVVPALDPKDPFRRVLAPWPLELLAAGKDAGADVDAAAIASLRLQVLDATGGPAMGAHVALVSLDASVDEPVTWPAETDAAGRLVLPVLPGRWLVIAVRDGRWKRLDLNVAVDQPVVTMQLEPMPLVRVQVVDERGAPLAGARARAGGASWGGTADPLQSAMQELARAFSSWSLGRAVSDADGRMEIPVMPADGLDVRYRVTMPDRRPGAGRLVADEQWVTITLEGKK